MAASIWGNGSDITLTCWRITNFKFLMTAPIFVLICFWHASGLAFLLSLNFLLTRDYCILTRVEIFHIIAFLFFSFFQLATPSKNFNPGLKSHYNQPLKNWVIRETLLPFANIGCSCGQQDDAKQTKRLSSLIFMVLSMTSFKYR